MFNLTISTCVGKLLGRVYESGGDNFYKRQVRKRM